MDFFDRLYLGFEAEYYIMGRLFGAGYEAFKMPADFGFDILVTNQKEQSLKSKTKQRHIQPPYALQIKSRRVKKEDFYNGPNGRQKARVEFTIKKQDLDLIISQDNAYLVCVIYLSDSLGLITNKVIYFWLHSLHLQQIQSLGGFRQQPDKQDIFELKSCIRLLPSVDTEKFIDENLVDTGHLTEEGKKILLKEFPNTLNRNWNASEYISIVIPSQNKRSSDPHHEVVKKIHSSLTNFGKLGMKAKVFANY